MNKDRFYAIRGIVAMGLAGAVLALAGAAYAGVTIEGKQAAARRDIQPIEEYTLKVDMGKGVSGFPPMGTKKFLAGKLVKYNYSAASGSCNLAVTLDGAAVAASGTFVMDKDHSLSAGASKCYGLTVTKNAGVNGTPETGTSPHALGTVINYSYTAAGGYMGPVVKLDGTLVADSGMITMNADHTLIANTRPVGALYTLKVGTGGINFHGDTDAGVDILCNVTGTPACGTHRILGGTTVNFSYEKKWENPNYGLESIALCPLFCPAGAPPWEQPGHVWLDFTDNGDSWVGSFVMTKDCALYVVRYRSE